MRRFLSQLFAVSTVIAAAGGAHAQRLPGPLPLPIPLCMPDISKSQPYTFDGSEDIGPLHVKGGLGATFAFNAGCGQLQASATGDVHVGLGSISAKPLELALTATASASGNSLDAKLMAFGHTMWMDNLASTTGPISDAKSFGYVLPGGNLAGQFSWQAPVPWLTAAASISYNTVANIAIAPIYTISAKEVTLREIASAAVSASVHGVASISAEGLSVSATGDGVIEIARLTQGGHATVKDQRRFPGDPRMYPYSADAAETLALTDVAGGYLTLGADLGFKKWSEDLFRISPKSYYPADFNFVYPQPLVFGSN